MKRLLSILLFTVWAVGARAQFDYSSTGPSGSGLSVHSNAPIVSTASTYAVQLTDTAVTFNGSASTAVTLGVPPIQGRLLFVRTIAAQTVVSASSNVVPLAGGSAGTAILAATAGKWALLLYDGALWQIIASN